jgi:hypothetical protein
MQSFITLREDEFFSVELYAMVFDMNQWILRMTLKKDIIQFCDLMSSTKNFFMKLMIIS